MKTKVTDLLQVLSAVDTVKTSKNIPEDQKAAVLRELLGDLPLDMFAHGVKSTRDTIISVINKEIENVSKKKASPKGKKVSSKSTKA